MATIEEQSRASGLTPQEIRGNVSAMDAYNQRARDLGITSKLSTPAPDIVEGRTTTDEFGRKTYSYDQPKEPVVLSSETGRRDFQAEVQPVIDGAKQNVQSSLEKQSNSDRARQGARESGIPEDLINEMQEGESPEQFTTRKTFENFQKRLDTERANMDTLMTLQSNEAQALKNTLWGEMSKRINESKQATETSKRNYSTIFARTGQSRYTPQATETFLSNYEQEGIRKLNEYSNEYAVKVREIDSALAKNQFSIVAEYSKTLGDLEDKSNDILSDMVKEAGKARRQSSLDDAIGGLMSQGITDPVQVLDFLNYDDKGNKIGDTTAKEVKETLENLVPEDISKNLPADAQLYEWARKNGQISSDTDFFSFLKKKKGAETTGSGQGYGTGGTNDLSDFMFVMSYLPSKLRDSDADKELLKQYYNEGKRLGKTPFQMVDELTGYRIDQPSAFSEGMRNFGLAHLDDPQQTAALGRLINNGQYEQAIGLVENAAYKKMETQFGTQYVSEADVSYVVDKTAEIEKLLGGGWVNEVGAFTGNFSKWLSRKFGSGQAVKIKAKLTSLTSDLIKKRAGSALTDTEWDRLVAGSVPEFDEAAKTWVSKLDELKSNPMQRLNSQRQQYELPRLDEASLKNRSLRIPSYSSSIASDPLQVDSEENTSDNPLGI